MSIVTANDFLDALYAFTTLRDRAALDIIKAVYRPSLISTIQLYTNTSRVQAELIFEKALSSWWDYPIKSLLGDQLGVVYDILKYIVGIVAPEELVQPEGLRASRESETFNSMSVLFNQVLLERMAVAGTCARLNEDAAFDIDAFRRKARMEDDMLRETFWLPIAFESGKKINDTGIGIKIANSVFDGLECKRTAFETLSAIKAYLYGAAEELCQWCLSAENGK